jgi:hypothetical protein
MATLGDLKQRIISETTRDDLADDLAAQFQNIVARSIDQYAAERWWFNERNISISTVAGQDFVLWPATVTNSARWIDGLYLTQNSGDTRWPITARSIDEFQELAQPNATGQPTDYLVADDRIFLFPTPNRIYQISADLIVNVTPPLVADTDANAWTNQGQDLITAQAKLRLYRDYLSASANDPRLVLALSQERDAYSRLRAESTRRTATGRLQPSW